LPWINFIIKALLVTLFASVFMHFPVLAFQSVTLAWDSSTDANVIGYDIHYGVSSGVYTNAISVGNATSVTISGLMNGVIYFFAATARDSTGLNSPFSNETFYGVPKAQLNVTANDAGQIYGDALPPFTASYSGFVNGDTNNNLATQGTLATSATASSSVGTYIVSVSGMTSPNYTIMSAYGTLGITPAALLITANNKSKIYGDALPAFSVSYHGFLLGDDSTSLTTQATFTTTAVATSDVDAYPITASGAVCQNYMISYEGGILAITPAVITVVADNQQIAYGALIPTLTATYSGFVLGQSTNDLPVLAMLSTTATPASGVGIYPITANGLTCTNYTFNLGDGTLTITQSLSS
jgi:hypothetical protein